MRGDFVELPTDGPEADVTTPDSILQRTSTPGYLDSLDVENEIVAEGVELGVDILVKPGISSVLDEGHGLCAIHAQMMPAVWFREEWPEPGWTGPHSSVD